ncbi:hypothetical protein BO70DRAFT_285619 [Aspergillus heteromorphus CBS 117.55]|uniref:Uncharacterized protein n=1 Tax=Aspergillus heteromorphus CBS 117.55 TaxID=1448321 RepID=A0A317WS38_9EURO|nr:uncharacterized protein BO70DRAFT_285619 [Aspergillus heteromorphus CBS 117.55]PWY89273.1 hypothetical protein BO70DRAFT_285619 [Aspergillus heteromorphus CBS 117.55]
MASKQRLTLASMWAFEAIGVEEVAEGIRHLELTCEYNKSGDVLEVKGNLENCRPKLAKVVSAFIDGQKDKDLLDMPRISQLDDSAPLQDASMAGSDEDDQGLLALDDGSDEVLVSHSRPRVTKIWLSSTGGAGCFAANSFQEFISQIATLTGTEIVIIGEDGAQVMGKDLADVEDALAKLSRIESALTFIKKPNVINFNASPPNDELRFRIQNYGSLNQVALSRILADPSMPGSSDLGQMFVTVLLSYDKEVQTFKEPANILNPPHVTEEPGKSRIWNDFTFPEIGKGDEYLAMEAVDERVAVNRQVTDSSISAAHPYLTAEKAKQVNQWVVERVEMEEPVPAAETETHTEVEPRDIPRPVPRPEPARTGSPAPAVKRPPGIMARRAIPASGRQPAPTESKPMKTQNPAPEEEPPTPRRKWKMIYNAEGATTRQTADARQETTSTNADTPIQEKRIGLPPSFDVTKYGLKNPRSPPQPQPVKSSWGRCQSKRTTSARAPSGEKKSGKRNELIDVFGPVTPAPTLLPTGTSSNIVKPLEPQPSTNVLALGISDNSLDLAGLTFETFPIPLEPGNSASVPGATPSSDEPQFPIDDRPFPSNEKAGLSSNERSGLSSGESVSEQARRLASLSRMYTESKDTASVLAESAHDDRPTSRQKHMDMAHDKVFELNRTHKTETRSDDEVVSRNFHRTMSHKAPKAASSKGKTKAETKAKKQATLEDAWGIFKKPLKKPPSDSSKPRPIPAPGKDAKTAPAIQENDEKEKTETDKDVDEHIRKVYEALKPTLEAAESFPGAMTLEIQIGLLLVPLLPKTYSGRLISFGEWMKTFQPQNGLAAPTTKFFGRVTTSGADADHFVALRTSKAEGKRRMFEQDESEYSVSYEYHCRTKAGQLFVIVIDEQGNFSVRQPVVPIGGVNLHFPGNTWDANVVVNRVGEYLPGSNVGFYEAAQHMIDHLWVQPGRSLLRIFTRLPEGGKVTIDKVFMKRWTRHRYIRSEEDPSKDPNDQNIFLQITEVQDLLIGTSPADAQAVRARAAGLQDMIRRGRLWYEVSLVSPGIESLLRSNADLEVGERAEDWRSADLLGRDAVLAGEPTPITPVATAIGAGGLGDLLRLTHQVMRKADGVGYWNEGPAAVFEMAESLAPATLPDNAIVSKGQEFEDIESIKEAGSADIVVLNPRVPSVTMEQVVEREFW